MPVWGKLTVLQAKEFLVISSISSNVEFVNAKLREFFFRLEIDGLLQNLCSRPERK